MKQLPGVKAIGTLVLDAASSSISTGAWTQVSASVQRAASYVEIFNSTGATLAVSTGSAGQESSHILPYTVLQGGSSILVPLEVTSGNRLSVKSLDNAATSGVLVMNLFG